MRLWHIDLIPFLPKSQLLAQWRELNSIFKKQDKHILINYIYEYPTFDALYTYTQYVKNEMYSKKYKVNTKNEIEFFKDKQLTGNMYFLEHNNEYLTICYWNLREKYLRGQKDFTDDVWTKLDDYYKMRIKGK